MGLTTEDALDGGGLVVGQPQGPVEGLVGCHAKERTAVADEPDHRATMTPITP
jgi:hypothetical protein